MSWYSGGDLEGLNFAGLVRLSRAARGSYVSTYEEPDTSAYKRKRVRLPDGGWRIGSCFRSSRAA